MKSFKEIWQERNPVHETNADTGEDMFWLTAQKVAEDFCSQSHPEQGEQGELYRWTDELVLEFFAAITTEPNKKFVEVYTKDKMIDFKKSHPDTLSSPPPEGQDERIKELEEEIEGLKEEVKRVSGVKVYEYTVEVDKWKEKVDHYKALAEAAEALMDKEQSFYRSANYLRYQSLKTQSPDREQRIVEGL